MSDAVGSRFSDGGYMPSSHAHAATPNPLVGGMAAAASVASQQRTHARLLRDAHLDAPRGPRSKVVNPLSVLSGELPQGRRLHPPEDSADMRFRFLHASSRDADEKSLEDATGYFAARGFRRLGLRGVPPSRLVALLRLSRRAEEERQRGGRHRRRWRRIVRATLVRPRALLAKIPLKQFPTDHFKSIVRASIESRRLIALGPALS